MADVTEIIHRISYEVNDDALINATKNVEHQLAQLNDLGKALDAYARQLNGLSSKGGKSFDDLAKKIDNLNKQITASAAKTEGALQEMFKGVLKGLDIDTDLKDAVGKYIGGVKAKFKELTGVAKNVSTSVNSFWTSTSSSSSKHSASVASSLAALGKSLTSVTGLFDIGVSILLEFGEELLETGNKAGILTGKITALNEINNLAAEDAAKVSTEIDILKTRFFNAITTVEGKKKVVNELNEKYGDTIGSIKGLVDAEDFFINRSGAFVQAMTIRARIQGAYNLLADNQQKLLEAQAKAPEDNVSELSKLGIGVEAFLKNPLEVLSRAGSPGLTGFYGGVEADFAKGLQEVNKKELETAEKDFEQLRNVVEQKIVDLTNELEEINRINKFNIDTQSGNGSFSNTNRNKNAGKLKTALKETVNKKDSLGQLPLRKAQLQPFTPELDPQHVELPENPTAKELEQLERRRKLLKSLKEAYQLMAESAVEAFNTIAEAQKKALDKEIEVRGKRVEEARKLAERGNTEALRLEEERLEAAQKKKEEVARREAVVNSALAVSNSLVAVTGAIANAVKGDPYSLAVRVAAAIAAVLGALSAGYAFVKSFDTDVAFADGVIDFKGIGGPRDDKNWVRISSGESVITAEGTRNNKALLEAINNGAVLKVQEPWLPYMQPVFKQPGVTNSYASVRDMEGLERKLDEVVQAIGENKLRQNIFFNEQGVGILTERSMNRNRRRWK